MVTLATMATSTAGSTAITEKRLTICTCSRAAALPRTALAGKAQMLSGTDAHGNVYRQRALLQTDAALRVQAQAGRVHRHAVPFAPV